MKIGDIALNSPDGIGYYVQNGKRYKTIGLSSSIAVDEQGNTVGCAFSHEPEDEVTPDNKG